MRDSVMLWSYYYVKGNGMKNNSTDIIDNDAFEESQRFETICLGCKGEKDSGLVVCWGCFKYRPDGWDFKYYGGSLRQWLKEIEMTNSGEERSPTDLDESSVASGGSPSTIGSRPL